MTYSITQTNCLADEAVSHSQTVWERLSPSQTSSALGNVLEKVKQTNPNAEISVKRIESNKSNELEIDQSKDLDRLEDDVNAAVLETIYVDLDIYFITFNGPFGALL